VAGTRGVALLGRVALAARGDAAARIRRSVSKVRPLVAAHRSGRSVMTRWDALAVVGLLAATAGAVMVSPWLVLVLYGVLAIVVAVVKGR